MVDLQQSIANSAAAVPVVPALQPGTMPTLRQFSVETYHRMIEAGALTENDRVQLIDGWIIEMPPIGPPHFATTGLVESVLRNILPPGWMVRTQGPITLTKSEPEPDVAVARGQLRDYVRRHPGPADLVLVIEIADSTLEFDRQQKSKIYAAAAIPEYWILNLIDRQVERHREPRTEKSGSEYGFREVIPAAGSLNFKIEDKVVGPIKVADLLP